MAWNPWRKTSTRSDLGVALPLCMDTYKGDRKSTRLNSSHVAISYAVFCLKKKTTPATSVPTPPPPTPPASCLPHPPDLPASPTRRSSDLLDHRFTITSPVCPEYFKR